MSEFVCPTCTYPSRLPNACDNPGCVENPRVTATQKAAWREAQERRAAQDAEYDRQRQFRLRTRGY